MKKLLLASALLLSQLSFGQNYSFDIRTNPLTGSFMAANATVEVTNNAHLMSVVGHFKDARKSDLEELLDYSWSLGFRKYFMDDPHYKPYVQGSMRFSKKAWRDGYWVPDEDNPTTSLTPLGPGADPIEIPNGQWEFFNSDSHWNEALLISLGIKVKFNEHWVFDVYAGSGMNTKLFTDHPHFLYNSRSLAFTAGMTVGLTF